MTDDVMSFCRQCGGERHHDRHAWIERPWSDDEHPIYGKDTWGIVECKGCKTASFVHEHYFSEDTVVGADGELVPEVHRSLHPPSPTRKRPEWGSDFFLSLPSGEDWINWLYIDIYEAVGIKSYALAAMGARAIVDHIVTTRATAEARDFKSKLKDLHQKGILPEPLIEVVYAAFDAGSAAAHRGYRPGEREVSILLDIAELMIELAYIAPMKSLQRQQDAKQLVVKTPKRYNTKG